MRPERWRLLGSVVGLALLALVGWQLLRFRGQLTMHWRADAWPWLAGALLSAMLAQAAFATAWHRLLAGKDAPTSSDRGGGWRHDAARWAVSLGGKYVPGKVFQAVLRMGAYRGRQPGAVLAPALAREILLSLGAAAAWVAVHVASDPSAPRRLLWPVAAMAVLLPLAALPRPWRELLALARRVAPDRVSRVAEVSPAGTGTGSRPGATGRSIEAWAWQLAGYLLLGLAVAALAHAFAPSAAPGWLACTGALCFGGIAGVIAFFVPAGIGVREAALAWYLAAWLPAGPAALLALAARVALTAAEFLGIALGLWQLRAEARLSPGTSGARDGA